jgi:hypothetical protein
MLPGVSAEDCLFSDLEIDPVAQGCQSWEATDFLLRGRAPDPALGLVLWQIGIVGVTTFERGSTWSNPGLPLLAETLLRHYPPSHRVTVYRAATLPTQAPRIERLPLSGLAGSTPPPDSTLYVPPAEHPPRGQRQPEGSGDGAGAC